MSAGKLDSLADLAHMVLEAEQMRLRQASERRRAAESRIEALDAAVARQHAVIAAELDAPVAGLVLDQWGAWAGRRRMALNTALAREHVSWEEQRQATFAAFGRAEALRRLRAKAEAEARRKLRRATLKTGG
jgi:hypothetical protein